MPELPEVERGRRVAEGVAAGRRIVGVSGAEDPIVLAGMPFLRLQSALGGRVVLACHRHGKQLWFELDRPPHPLFHFGMSGAFRVPGIPALRYKSGPDETRPEWPPRYTKIHLRFEDGGELVMTDGRRLGRIGLRDEPRAQPPISRLGPDPLLGMPGARTFARMLAGRGALVKPLLLDQTFLAGIGNWIADEVLYQARIDPRRRARDLDAAAIGRLHRAIRRVIRLAVEADADDRRYPRHWLFHHRWGRQAGARTARGEAIEHVTLGGRTAAWVPSVQR